MGTIDIHPRFPLYWPRRMALRIRIATLFDRRKGSARMSQGSEPRLVSPASAIAKGALRAAQHYDARDLAALESAIGALRAQVQRSAIVQRNMAAFLHGWQEGAREQGHVPSGPQPAQRAGCDPRLAIRQLDVPAVRRRSPA